MVRLVFAFAFGLLVAACKFDGGGIPQDAAPVFPDADPSCVPTGDEQCNTLDDDCDGPVDEDFPTLGDACDGAGDSDECLEGTFGCTEAGDDVVCSDDTDSTVETCDGTDEDCNGTMDDGFDVGDPCDGADLDMCTEGGVWECDGGGDRQCTDTSGDTVEVCNTLDDDCDGSPDEDFLFATDELHCGDCDTQCLTGGGTFTTTNDCLASTCTPVCSAGAMDCDGNAPAGCEQRDTTPACTVPTDLGNLNGDTGSDTANRVRYAEAWFVVDIDEGDMGNGGGDIQANVVLTNPAGVNFDLYVYCTGACPAGTLIGSSTNVAGMTDTVFVGNDDTNSTDNGFTVLIEVRYFGATACGDYTLTVNGSPADNNANNCGSP